MFDGARYSALGGVSLGRHERRFRLKVNDLPTEPASNLTKEQQYLRPDWSFLADTAIEHTRILIRTGIKGRTAPPSAWKSNTWEQGPRKVLIGASSSRPR